MSTLDIEIPYGRRFLGENQWDEYAIVTNRGTASVILDGCSVERRSPSGGISFAFRFPVPSAIRSYHTDTLVLPPGERILLVTGLSNYSVYGRLRYERNRTEGGCFMFGLNHPEGHLWDNGDDYLVLSDTRGTAVAWTRLGTERARQYEVFVASIFEGFRSLLPASDVEVFRGRKLTGSSGQVYQIDVSIVFNLMDIRYLTLVECKHYRRAVGVGELLEFSAKIDDIGAHKGIMVTTRSFQEGCFHVARSRGIALVVVREETGADFDVNLAAYPYSPVTHDYVFGRHLWMRDEQQHPVVGIIKCKNWSLQDLLAWHFYICEGYPYRDRYKGLHHVLQEVYGGLSLPSD